MSEAAAASWAARFEAATCGTDAALGAVAMRALPHCVARRNTRRDAADAFVHFLRWADVTDEAAFAAAGRRGLEERWGAYREQAAVPAAYRQGRDVPHLIHIMAATPDGKRRRRLSDRAACDVTGPGVAFCVPAGADAPAAEFVRGLFALHGRRPVRRLVLRAAPAFLVEEGLASAAAFCAVDGPTLRERVRAWWVRRGRSSRGHCAVHAFLVRCRRHPDLDPSPHPFSTHLHAVPRDYLDAFPRLRMLPVSFAVFLRRTVPDPEDVLHLTDLAAECALARNNGDRNLDRTCATVCGFLLRFLPKRRHMDPDSARGPWREFLSTELDTAGLLSVLGRFLGVTNRHLRRQPVAISGTGADADDVLAGYFASLVRAQWFANVPAETVLRASLVRRAKDRWVQRFPAYYASAPPERPRQLKPPLTKETIRAVLAAAVTCEERAVLLLYTTLGLRTFAVAHARVADVFDAAAGAVREEFSLLEKGSVRRRVRPFECVREALHAYLDREHPRNSPLLFPARDRPQLPSPKHIEVVVGRVVARADLGPLRINRHQFRKYVVDSLLALGWSLEEVAKWIGHRTVGVTFRHYMADNYWRQPLAAAPTPASDAQDREGLFLLLRAREYDAFRRRLAAYLPPDVVAGLEEGARGDAVAELAGRLDSVAGSVVPSPAVAPSSSERPTAGDGGHSVGVSAASSETAACQYFDAFA